MQYKSATQVGCHEKQMPGQKRITKIKEQWKVNHGKDNHRRERATRKDRRKG